MALNKADQLITNQVNLKLSNRGIRTPCRVTVLTKNGEVTLTGTVQFAHQKSAATQAATGIAGVKRVVDQTTVNSSKM
ncbi:MAG TPA: BON domain-containing protein [Pseudoxanthomonas sp.]|nr:BON domain-containing protein [Pseudoxanthomonas sp.]